jgi:hypothetical protein
VVLPRSHERLMLGLLGRILVPGRVRLHLEGSGGAVRSYGHRRLVRVRLTVLASGRSIVCAE